MGAGIILAFEAVHISTVNAAGRSKVIIFALIAIKRAELKIIIEIVV